MHYPSMKTNITPPSSGLRVRRQTVNRNGVSHHPSLKRELKEECHIALMPVFVIAAVWLLGCWVLIWARMYQSFSENLTNHPLSNLGNKRDILSARLRQFLDHGNTTNYDSSWVLKLLAEPDYMKQVQELLMKDFQYPQLVLGAYLEPPLQTDERGLLKLRTHGPENLTYVSYSYKKSESSTLGACSQNGAQWTLPTFHPPGMDHHFESNVFRKKNMFDIRWELASGVDSGNTNGGYCPVDADPYLPWIHDVFPSRDGKFVEFIISNKRRCNTDPKVFQSDLKNLEPQVALMQPIPVKRAEYQWGNNISIVNEKSPISYDQSYQPSKYVLATALDAAAEDGKFTRFICRFHTLILSEKQNQTKLKQVILGESLSIYPYNPEHANYIKRGSKPMLTSPEKGHDEQIWNSVYSIRCPVPELKNGTVSLRSLIASGKTISQSNGAPSIYIDLIPIRTQVRTNKEGFGIPGIDITSSFDPKHAWGEDHVLPRVELSGRWANIPVCMPPVEEQKLPLAYDSSMPNNVNIGENTSSNKSHFLVGCVWASRSFSTRGQTTATDSSTSDRLLEFLTYHTAIAGFDHMYVYDNSDTSIEDNNTASLAHITNLFSSQLVTRIPWPHRICNNNRPAHSNPGERSSQYAAEASCRARYGPNTEWMISMDVDEFLIPVSKKWQGIKEWLQHVTATEKDTAILSFFQTRALPNIDLMLPYNGLASKSCKVKSPKDAVLDATCAMKNPNKTYMETYNCEPTRHPKPQTWAWRAKKQIYKPSFVWNHFVHYSVVTRLVEDKPFDDSGRFQVKAPYERRVNELTEGFMLHTKTTSPEMTSNWQSQCPRKVSPTKSSCAVGIPSAEILGAKESSLYQDGISASALYEANCFRHSRVIELIPRLEQALRLVTNHHSMQ